MHEIHASVLAVEAEKTLMIDNPSLLQAADTLGICVVALAATECSK
jgi:DUF1009 family protein